MAVTGALSVAERSYPTSEVGAETESARLRWRRKGCVVRVIRLASCLGLWFQSICPLMPSLSAYRLTWVSLTLDEVAPPDLERGVAPL